MPSAITHTEEQKEQIRQGRELEAAAYARLAEAVAAFVPAYHEARALWEQARDLLQANRVTPADFAPIWRTAVKRQEWDDRRA